MVTGWLAGNRIEQARSGGLTVTDRTKRTFLSGGHVWGNSTCRKREAMIAMSEAVVRSAGKRKHWKAKCVR